jgi:hypothetical protein
MIHSSGSIACENTRISVHLVANPNVYSFRIFKSGMENITSAAVYYMLNGSSMYPDAYVEGILTAYYADIFDQIRDYHDECGELNVINTRQSINRHFRMAAGNPTYTFENNLVKFTVEQMYADQRLYPIDFYIEVDQKLHIIPVEALENGTLSVSDLPRWKARE